MKIVIVDDSTTQLKITERTLAAFGEYEIHQALDGAEAFRLIDRNTDLVLTDWNMPRMDGLELVKKIREDPELQEVPIVMITSHGESRKVMEALSAGVDDFIVKPLKREVLAKKINVYLVKNALSEGRELPNTGLTEKKVKRPPVNGSESERREKEAPAEAPDPYESIVSADKDNEKVSGEGEQNEDVYHQLRENDKAQLQYAKEVNQMKFGRLECEVCGDGLEDEEGKYEAHFDAPSKEDRSQDFAKSAKLRIVCGNCHKIIHSQRPYLEVDELREILQG